MPHGGELADYHGAFGFVREGAAVLSVPPDRLEMIRGRFSSGGGEVTPNALLQLFLPGEVAKVIGPAFVGYTAALPPVPTGARSLGDVDAGALERLRLACEELDWEHGGSAIEQVVSGVFDGAQLASVAGYEVWGGVIAHISVVTHPGRRGRGHGRQAVAHVASRALQAGLVPQYRTLMANAPSMRVARELGFEEFATTVAVRFPR